MKIGKTGNTLNDTQPQQAYGCIIATHHLGEKSSSNPAESPSFNANLAFWRGVKQADWGGGTAKIERGLFDQ